MTALPLLKLYSRVAPTERGGFHLVRLARKSVPKHQWQGTFTTPDDIRLTLDLGTYPDCCMAVGLYELDTYRTLRRLLKPGSHFVDGGANIGYFTTLATKWVGDEGRVDAFEPDPQNRRRLETHLQDNDLVRRVCVHPVALGETNGSLELVHPRDDHNHGETTAFGSLLDGETFDVDVVRMDERLDRTPDVVKLDIEGGELAAIRGMAGLLRGDAPPAIIVEHNPRTAAAAGFAPGDLMRELLNANPDFNVYWIGWKLHRVESPEGLDAIERQGNLLAVRENRN